MSAPSESPDNPPPLSCARCGVGLVAGSGDFYQITIEAVADPWPPLLPDEGRAPDLRREIESLIARMQDLTEEEAMEQVYHRETLYLCSPCYRNWIKNPVR